MPAVLATHGALSVQMLLEEFLFGAAMHEHKFGDAPTSMMMPIGCDYKSAYFEYAKSHQSLRQSARVFNVLAVFHDIAPDSRFVEDPFDSDAPFETEELGGLHHVVEEFVSAAADTTYNYWCLGLLETSLQDAVHFLTSLQRLVDKKPEIEAQARAQGPNTRTDRPWPIEELIDIGAYSVTGYFTRCTSESQRLYLQDIDDQPHQVIALYEGIQRSSPVFVKL